MNPVNWFEIPATDINESRAFYEYIFSIEDTLVKIKEKSGKALHDKMSIGEYGFVAHFEDNAGNRVALHSTK